MATAYLEFGSVTPYGRGFTAHNAKPRASEAITPTSTNAVSTGAAATDGEVLYAFADVDCWLAFDATPNAGAAPRRFLPAFTPREFLLSAGQKVGIRTVA